jgi:hypothetical protein
MKRVLDRIHRWILPKEILPNYPYFDRNFKEFPLDTGTLMPKWMSEEFKEKNKLSPSYGKAGVLKGYKKIVDFFWKKECFIGHMTEQRLYNLLQDVKRNLSTEIINKPSGDIKESEVYFLRKHTYTGNITPLRNLNLSSNSLNIQTYRDSTSIFLKTKPSSHIYSSSFKPFYLPNLSIDPSQTDISKLKQDLAEFLYYHPISIEIEDYGIFTPYNLSSSPNSFEFHTLRLEKLPNNTLDKELQAFLSEHFGEELDMYLISDIDGCLKGNSLIE